MAYYFHSHETYIQPGWTLNPDVILCETTIRLSHFIERWYPSFYMLC